MLWSIVDSLFLVLELMLVDDCMMIEVMGRLLIRLEMMLLLFCVINF